MSLNCPICGKKYHYDMKICEKCEETSNYSRLISKNEINGWKCDTFLDSDHFVFGKIKKTSSIKKINSINEINKNNEKLFEKYKI